MLSLQLPTDAGHDGYETQKGWNVGICYCHFFLNSSKFQTKVPNKHKDASVKNCNWSPFSHPKTLTTAGRDLGSRGSDLWTELCNDSHEGKEDSLGNLRVMMITSGQNPTGGLVREMRPLFQGNLGWWNIIIWPDKLFFLVPLEMLRGEKHIDMHRL